MLAIPLHKLAGNPDKVRIEAMLLYRALLGAALRENNLRAYLEADLALASLEFAKYPLEAPGAFEYAAHYLKAEPQDSLELLAYTRRQINDNPPIGWCPPAG